jgi:hypothetical protein
MKGQRPLKIFTLIPSIQRGINYLLLLVRKKYEVKIISKMYKRSETYLFAAILSYNVCSVYFLKSIINVNSDTYAINYFSKHRMETVVVNIIKNVEF